MRTNKNEIFFFFFFKFYFSSEISLFVTVAIDIISGGNCQQSGSCDL